MLAFGAHSYMSTFSLHKLHWVKFYTNLKLLYSWLKWPLNINVPVLFHFQYVTLFQQNFRNKISSTISRRCYRHFRNSFNIGPVVLQYNGHSKGEVMTGEHPDWYYKLLVPQKRIHRESRPDIRNQ